MPSDPYIPFYVGDYKKSLLRSASMAARGFWLELRCVMWESARRGFLAMPNGLAPSPEQLSRLVGGSAAECDDFMAELVSLGAVSREEATGLWFDPELVGRAESLKSAAFRQAKFRDEDRPERPSPPKRRGPEEARNGRATRGATRGATGGVTHGVTHGVTPNVTPQSNPIQSNPIQDPIQEEGPRADALPATASEAEAGCRADRDADADADADFGRFWAAYPRRDCGEKKARRAFADAARKRDWPGIETALSAVAWFRRTEQWQEPRFIPSPVTWLSDARWTGAPANAADHAAPGESGGDDRPPREGIAAEPEAPSPRDRIAACVERDPDFAAKWKAWTANDDTDKRSPRTASNFAVAYFFSMNSDWVMELEEADGGDPAPLIN